MRAVIQRVNYAKLRVEGSIFSKISNGLVVLLGVTHDDGVEDFKWLAKKINHPKSYRAIGNALSKNPVPIIIPCHRVISIDGTIGGYMGKEKKIYFKKQLLELERK